jgi:hypothetical protein
MSYKISNKTGSNPVNNYLEAQRRAAFLSTLPNHGETVIIGAGDKVIAKFREGKPVGRRDNI